MSYGIYNMGHFLRMHWRRYNADWQNKEINMGNAGERPNWDENKGCFRQELEYRGEDFSPLPANSNLPTDDTAQEESQNKLIGLIRWTFYDL